MYCKAGNFCGVQFSQMVDLHYFTGLIFADALIYTHCVLYIRAYFAGLIFVVRRLSVKTAKIGPHENFPLYGMQTCNVYANTKSITCIGYITRCRSLRDLHTEGRRPEAV